MYSSNNGLLPGIWQSYDRHVKTSGRTGPHKSMTAGQLGGEWSLTLTATASGRPADWLITEAKLAPELVGSRHEMIERTIRDTTVAHLNTTNYSAEMVQRGFELYKAINDSNGVSGNVKSNDQRDITAITN